MIDIKRDKISCEVEKWNILEKGKNKKNYINPNLIDLGKMQKVTLGNKGGSNLDSDTLNNTPEFN